MLAKNIIFVILGMLCSPMIFAQNTLDALVKDASTHETLVGVTCQIKALKMGAVSNEKGEVHLLNIPNGTYEVLFSYIGYTSQTLAMTFPMKSSPSIIELQPEVVQNDEIVVSSFRTNGRMEDLPTKVEVLGLEEMNEENGIKPGNILSLLGDIAGIQLQQTSANSGNTDVKMQGMAGKYTQIIRDGLPLYDGFSGGFGVLQIPPLDLKQIEIIKGSVSTLYGGGAVSGVINLISKEPTNTPETAFTLNQTTLKERNLNIYSARRFGTSNKWGYSVFTGMTSQKASDVNKDGFSDSPYIQSFLVHPRLFATFNPQTSANVGVSFTTEKRNGGDMVALDAPTAAHPYFESNNTNRVSSDFSFMRRTSATNRFTLRGSTSRYDRLINQSGYHFQGIQTSWYSEGAYLLASARHQTVMGVNVVGNRFEKGAKSDASRITNFSQNTLGAFVQDDWNVTEALTLESGLRVDHHSTEGVFVLPRLSLLYKLNTHLSLRFNGGYGYATPNLFAEQDLLNDIQHLASVPSAVVSERAKGANLDIKYNTIIGEDVTLFINESAYFNQINHPIEAVTGADGTLSLHNADGTIESKGSDFYMQLSKAPFELYLGYNVVIPESVKGDQRTILALTPRHKFSYVLAFDPNEHWRFGLESSYQSSQFLSDRSTVSGYLFVAGMIGYKIGRFNFVLNGENLLDYRQKDVVMLPFTHPTFRELYAPIDGRVLNLSVHVKL